MVTDDEASPTKSKIDLSTTQLLAGAGATITVSVISSYWGVVGTLAGAGITSVVSSVVTSVYKLAMDRTHSRIRGGLKMKDFTHLRIPKWTPRQWGLAALVPLGLFGGTMAVLTGAEAAAGKPVSAIVRGDPGHGTTLGGGDVGTPTPQPSATTSTLPTGVPTSTATSVPTSTAIPTTAPTSVPTTSTAPTTAPTSVSSPLTTAEPAPPTKQTD